MHMHMHMHTCVHMCSALDGCRRQRGGAFAESRSSRPSLTTHVGISLIADLVRRESSR